MDNDSNKSRNIRIIIDHFNKICTWVATTIVLGSDKKMRALIIENFISTAMELKELRNYFGLLEIMTGLSFISIQRLHQTWKLLPEITTKNYEQLKLIVAFNNNSKKNKKINFQI